MSMAFFLILSWTSKLIQIIQYTVCYTISIMDCKFVKDIDLLTFAFNKDRSSIFYLIETQCSLKIIEENLYTGAMIAEYKVPLSQKRMEADNYILNYNRKLKVIILAIGYHILIYSTEDTTLIFSGKCQGKTPYIITKLVGLENASNVFFSAVEQRNIYCLNIDDCIATGDIPNMTKLKLPQDVYVVDMKAFDNKLIAACNDKVIRCWNIHYFTSLKGIRIEPTSGEITSIAFSGDGGRLLAGTSRGELFAWDGKTLGSGNQLILSQKISDKKIICLSWFHYCGELQSKRFITITEDKNVRLFSFILEKTQIDKRHVYLGKANELSILSQIKEDINDGILVKSHSYSNHICFNPGRVIYLVDYTPILYYPIISNQLTHSFVDLIPLQNNDLFWQRQIYFIEGMEIKQLKEGVHKRLSLSSVLAHDDLKILKLEVRPFGILPSNTFKFLIEYYLGAVKRILFISKFQIDSASEMIEQYKQYSCSMGLFLGNPSLTDPLIFLLNEDRQSVSILSNYQKSKRESIIAKVSRQEAEIYMKSPGQISQASLHVKIQKVYSTPFRSGYCVIYRTESLLRFSRNYVPENSLLEFQLLHQPQLKIDYNVIIVDIVWCSCEEPIGAIACLDKVIFVKSNLKQIITVPIEGYIVQSFWQGYTLFVVTKVNVFFVSPNGISVPLYSLDSQEDKYLICMLLGDRIISAARPKPSSKKKDKQLDIKTRYFNLMEPLIFGYVGYCSIMGLKVNEGYLKRIVQCFQPVPRVSQEFLHLLNANRLSLFSQYLIEQHPKSYSMTIKMETFSYLVGFQKIVNVFFDRDYEQGEFWKNRVYYRQEKVLLQTFYQALESVREEDEASQNNVMSSNKVKMRFSSNLNKVKAFLKECVGLLKTKGKLELPSVLFGQKSLIQKYKDLVGSKQVDKIIDEIEINSVGQWIGLFSNFIEVKIESNGEEEVKDEFVEPEGEFNDLVVYYRFDEGKGNSVGDLSDYGNDAIIQNYEGDALWVPLENEEPLEMVDNWGKKCPQQYSIRIGKRYIIQKSKAVKLKPFSDFTIEIWLKPCSSGVFLNIQDTVILSLVESEVVLNIRSNRMKLSPKGEQKEQPQVFMNRWTHVALAYSRETNTVQLILNCMTSYVLTTTEDISISSLETLSLGSNQYQGQLTEFRLWKQCLSVQEIRDGFKSPLSIVAEKRKKVTLKIKDKKNKDSQQINLNDFALDMMPSNPDVGGSKTPVNVMDWGMPF